MRGKIDLLEAKGTYFFVFGDGPESGGINERAKNRSASRLIYSKNDIVTGKKQKLYVVRDKKGVCFMLQLPNHNFDIMAVFRYVYPLPATYHFRELHIWRMMTAVEQTA